MAIYEEFLLISLTKISPQKLPLACKNIVESCSILNKLLKKFSKLKFQKYNIKSNFLKNYMTRDVIS